MRSKTGRFVSPAVAALVVVAAAPIHAQTTAGSKALAVPAGVEARADETLRRMAAFLAQAKAFQLEAEETFDVEFAHAYRVQLANVRTLSLERPSRFAAVATGDTLHRASWYDGKSLTVLNRKLNAYAVLDMPGTIDAVLDKIAADYGVVLPLSDLLYADPYAALMDGVLYGKYLGVHQAAGVPCHHLTFGQDGIEWQIWIDTGAQPLPRKLAIAYWEDSGVPQYQAVLRRWSLDVKNAPDHFVFKAPAGARKVELAELAAGAAGASTEH